MGFKTFGFGGGREDVWEPDQDVYWGDGEAKWLGCRQALLAASANSRNPLAAVQMGLIYVNPEGPNGNPDPVAAARDIRETFAPHGDERRGDRRADRRRPHLRQDARRRRRRRTSGADPEARRPRSAGLRLEQQVRHRHGRRRDHQRPRSHVDDARRRKWSNDFFENLFGYEWELTKSPAGAHQWRPKNGAGAGTVPDAHDPSKTHRADDADDRSRAALRSGLREDLAALPRASRSSSPTRSRAPGSSSRIATWGRASRYLGPEVPEEELIWQDPIPAVDHPLIDDAGHRCAEEQDPRARGCRCRELVSTAWASASTFRGSDKRGGANGARIRLAPQKDWEVNQPAQLAKVLKTLEGIQSDVQQRADGRQEGLARRPDRARRRRGRRAGGEEGRARSDGAVHAGPHGRVAGADRRRVVRGARAGRRRLPQLPRRASYSMPAEALLVDRAQLLTLTAPEMTVLVGGLRVLGANVGGIEARRVHEAARDADERLLRQPARHGHGVESDVGREGRVRRRAIARPARSSGPARASTSCSARTRSCARSPRSMAARMRRRSSSRDFVAAWTKVMNLDRFDAR